MDFPANVIHEIFARSDFVDMVRASSVSSHWLDVSTDKDLGNFLNFENRSKISLEQFKKFCHRYPNATGLNIYGVSSLNSLAFIENAGCLLRNLETLHIGKGWLDDAFFSSLRNFDYLKTLSIRDAALPHVYHMTVAHDGLQMLEIVNCRSVQEVIVICDQLEVLSVRIPEVKNISVMCPDLRKLDIGSCRSLAGSDIRNVVKSCPLLESLDVSDCSKFSQDTLSEIAQHCTNLVYLNASGYKHINFRSVLFPKLRVLKLLNFRLTENSISAISMFHSLVDLELSGVGYSDISLNNQHLQSFRLTDSSAVHKLFLKTPELSFVNISECPSLHEITILSKSIRKLELPGLKNLSSLELDCQVLEEINLAECEKFTSVTYNFDVYCPSLKSLVLDFCKNLTEVKLLSSSLRHLSLSHNSALISLELNCPHLEQLHLNNCCNLKQAQLFPVGLESLNLGMCPKLQYLHIYAPRMDTLDIKGCGALSDLSTCCPVLSSLDASFCSKLTDICLQKMATSSPLIESLTLTSCLSIGPHGLSSLQSLEQLTYLDLSYTLLTNLQQVFKSCLHLKVLRLQACKDLADYSLQPLYKYNALPALQELDLSHGSLSQSAITELLNCCSRLRTVSLNGCANLHNFNGCMISMSRCLQSLNCVGCPNINKFSSPFMTGYAELVSLNLSLSKNLKEVDIASPSLKDLNLSRCGSLGKLKLDCPRLTSLFLQFTSITEHVLDDAISQCTMLVTLDVRGCPKIKPRSKGRLHDALPNLRFLSISPASA